MRPRRHRARTRSGQMLGLLCAVGFLALGTGCSSALDGTAQVDATAARDYRTDQSTSAEADRQAATSDAGYALCATTTTAVASMLRTYNTFVAALNDKQAYTALGGADSRAVDEFTRGSTVISDAVTPQVSDRIRDDVRQLLDRTGVLSRAVASRARGPLNDASNAWLRARDVVVRSCGVFTSPSQTPSPPPTATPSSPSPVSPRTSTGG